MTDNSVDDDYQGCERQMLQKVQQTYLNAEREKCKDFDQAWDKAATYYKNKSSGPLDKMEAMAIHVYVNPYVKIFKPFNRATLIGKAEYTSGYQYHSLHFLLTRALQKLNKKNIKKWLKIKQKTFRGTNVVFNGKKGTMMRFGQFTSSSKNKMSALRFGNVTCFDIQTLHGAALEKYSTLPHEEEVLIPPFEVFKITKVMETKEGSSLQCQVVYTLKSCGKKSNLRCKVAKLIERIQN